MPLMQFALQTPVFTGFYKNQDIKRSKRFGAKQPKTPIKIEKVWRKMEVKGKYNYEYSNVNFKISVAKRFRSFSKKIAKSHSESLNIIIDFFEWHGFLPSNRFPKSIVQEIIKNRKRTDATIAIIKSIEKDQTKPTNAMLLSLFEENSNQVEEVPQLVERKFLEDAPEEKHTEQTTVPKIRYKRLEDRMNSVQQDFKDVLDKVKTVKSNFGKNYLKLNISENELEKLKRKLKNP